MIISSLNDMAGGWFVGNFEPTLYKNPYMEIAVHDLESGHKSDGHYHKEATEINLILSGVVSIDGKMYPKDSIFIFLPGERTNIECLNRVKLLVCKFPSVPGDKYYD